MLPSLFGNGRKGLFRQEAFMIRAVIDIGTNSARLLVADGTPGGEWRPLVRDMEASRLGEGMTNEAAITEGARFRTREAVEKFIAEAKEAGAEEILGFGTSILRDAPEGAGFAAELEKATGIPVKILSGEEEAFYSYLGAVGLSSAVAAVADVGGSTELCMGYGPAIGFRRSFPLGCVRCSDLFDTTTARGLGELKKHCFQKFQDTKELTPVKQWIGVGGTMTSIASMLQGLETYDPAKIQGYVIHAEDVSALLRKLYQMSYEDRCQFRGLRADRADIIVAGVAIVDSIMEYFALTEMTVSDRGLTEGLLDADAIRPECNG